VHQKLTFLYHYTAAALCSVSHGDADEWRRDVTIDKMPPLVLQMHGCDTK
jgi:hypothetical protein